MVIPTYKVVDCDQLAEEMHNKTLTQEFHDYFLGGEWGVNGDWTLDYIVTPNDPEWHQRPQCLLEAYDYLMSMYGLHRREIFIWISRV